MVDIDPFEARITAVFLSAHWHQFLDFLAEHGIDEQRGENIVRVLEGEPRG